MWSAAVRCPGFRRIGRTSDRDLQAAKTAPASGHGPEQPSWRFFEPGGRPEPGWDGFGAPAGEPAFARRFPNPRRTRAGVSLFGGADFSPYPG
jgi:hypothetical protein